MPVSRTDVERLLPELEFIQEEEVRTGVIDAWMIAANENQRSDLATVPWLPTYQSTLELSDETLIQHIRDVTTAAIGLGEAVSDSRDIDVSMDTVIAGGLIHDVSQLGEFAGWDITPIGKLFGHPYYGVYVALSAGLPINIAHIVLSHTSQTLVEPATIEADIVAQADHVIANAIRWRIVDDLRDAPPV